MSLVPFATAMLVHVFEPQPFGVLKNKKRTRGFGQESASTLSSEAPAGPSPRRSWAPTATPPGPRSEARKGGRPKARAAEGAMAVAVLELPRFDVPQMADVGFPGVLLGFLFGFLVSCLSLFGFLLKGQQDAKAPSKRSAPNARFPVWCP